MPKSYDARFACGEGFAAAYHPAAPNIVVRGNDIRKVLTKLECDSAKARVRYFNAMIHALAPYNDFPEVASEIWEMRRELRGIVT